MRPLKNAPQHQQLLKQDATHNINNVDEQTSLLEPGGDRQLDEGNSYCMGLLLIVSVAALSLDGLLLRLNYDISREAATTSLHKYFASFVALAITQIFSYPFTNKINGHTGVDHDAEETFREDYPFFIRAVLAVVGCTLTSTLALIYGDPGVVALLLGLSPIWGALLGRMFANEELTWCSIWATLFSFLAAALCIIPHLLTGDALHVTQGRRNVSILIGTAAGGFMASLVVINRTAPRTLCMEYVPLVAAFLAAMIMLVVAYVGGSALVPHSWKAFGYSSANGASWAFFSGDLGQSGKVRIPHDDHDLPNPAVRSCVSASVGSSVHK